MKKVIIYLIISLFTLGTLVGCTSDASGLSELSKASEDHEISIVCTTFPQYDWLKEIIGEQQEHIKLTLLMNDGVDLHNYQPTVDDMVTIAECDMFIHVGGQSDRWVDDVLKQATNKDMIVINMTEVLEGEQNHEGEHNPIELHDHDEAHEHTEACDHEESHEHTETCEHEEGHEHTEACEHEEGHEHTEACEHEEGHEHTEACEHEEGHEHTEACEHEESHEHTEVCEHEEGHEHTEACEHEEGHEHTEACSHEAGEEDEHIWLSLKNAQILCEYITLKMCELDAPNETVYKDNGEAYRLALEELDQQYEKATGESNENTLIFGDRFPFAHLVTDYDLDYYAAFEGCSTEIEASFETITFLSQKIDELAIDTVLTVDGSNHKVANTIIQNTKDQDQDIATLDAMQSITSNHLQDGATYLSIMEENLEVLKEVLR